MLRGVLGVVGWVALIFSVVNGVAIGGGMFRGPAVDVGATVSIVCLLGGLTLLALRSILEKLDALLKR